jgi:expansin (peptidoglycan-binding protein)
MVTAEFAVALPAFIIVVVAALAAIAVVTAQLRCVDAAATAARMAARGDAVIGIRATALSGAPGGAQLSVLTGNDTVTAVVEATIALPGILGFLPGIAVHSRVVEAREPGLSAPSAAASP